MSNEKTVRVVAMVTDGGKVDLPFPMEVEVVDNRANTSQVIKEIIDAYNKQKEILDILKERAYLYVNDVNKDVKSIQISITTCNDRFDKVEEWLNDK